MSIKEAMQEVRRLNRMADRKKGKNNEDKTDQALSILQEQGKITTYWHANYREDQDGTDFRIQLSDGGEKSLQVKSSVYYMVKFKAVHPFIPCIVVEDDVNTNVLANKILNILK